MSSHFAFRTFLAIGGLIVITVLLSGATLTWHLRRSHDAELHQRLARDARALASQYTTLDATLSSTERQERLRHLGEALGTRLTVIDAAGRVLADSAFEAATMHNHGSRPEVSAALDTGNGSSTRDAYIYYAFASDHNGSPLVFRAGLPEVAAEESNAALATAVLSSHALVLILALGLSFLLTRRLVRPIARMAETAASIAEGEFGRRIRTRDRDEIGQLARAFNTMADQLQHRIAHTTDERNRLESILASLAEGLLAVNGQSQITHLNSQAMAFLEVDEHCLGRLVWEAIRQPAIVRAVDRVLDSGQPYRDEYGHIRGGNTHSIAIQARGIRQADGRTVGAVIALHDITEIRYIENIRRDFVANVSHELKTPLAAILGLIETILDDPSMPTAMRDNFLQRALRQGQRLASIVSDLLALSRLESPDALHDYQPCDLVPLVRDSIDFLTPTAADKQIRLQPMLAPDSVIVIGDAALLRQAFDNLIDNAIKYSPEGTNVQVGLSVQNGTVDFLVSDEGPGITKADQARIFERFFRVDKARSRHLGGTGLGLSIVKHIMRTHGGDIVVDSAPGEGSTFTLTLPLASEDE